MADVTSHRFDAATIREKNYAAQSNVSFCDSVAISGNRVVVGAPHDNPNSAYATRVIASLWNVGGEATAVLMMQFYQNPLKGKSSPAALHHVQVLMWREPRWQSPCR